MGELQIEIEPGAAGFDGDRLTRIDRHFRRYVDDGRLPGWQLVVARDGKVVHTATYGRRDVEADAPVEVDTLWRIYSMTKPITSVAALSLYEEGAFELKHSVGRYIPSFRDARVYRQGSAIKPETEPVTEPLRIWHLLTHTAGLTYGFHHAHPVDAIYRTRGYEWGTPGGKDLAACCDDWASMPLLFQPGREWNYGVSTDVLGRVLEVVTGSSLDHVLAERVFEPLGMHDTSFHVEPHDRGRLAALYGANPVDRTTMRLDILGDVFLSPPACLSGGGGLVSTAADYHRFATMLLNRGELDGARILAPRTVDYMARNHLPGGADLEAIGRPLFAETTFQGVGFGLGVSVLLDPVENKVLSSPGEYGWGGAASTAFWVDPVERITVLFFTQLLPSSTYPIRSELRPLVYGALF